MDLAILPPSSLHICYRLLVPAGLPFCSIIAVDCVVHIRNCCRTVNMLPAVPVPADFISELVSPKYRSVMKARVDHNTFVCARVCMCVCVSYKCI